MAATLRSAPDAAMWPAPLVVCVVEAAEEEAEPDALAVSEDAPVADGAAELEELLAAALFAPMTLARSWGNVMGLPPADMSTVPSAFMVSGFLAKSARA